MYYTVREAKSGDIKGLVKLIRVAHAEHGAEIATFDPDVTRNTFQRLINQTGGAVYALVNDDYRIVGCLALVVNQIWFSRTKEVVDMVFYVEPEARGYGNRLLMAGTGWAKSLPGVSLITMGVTTGIDSDERLGRLYAHTGFKRVGSYYTYEFDKVLRPGDQEKRAA